MIVQFLFIVLLCYGTVNGSDEKTSKILSCIQPSQPKRTTADGNRTWFVSGNSTGEQGIICSHIATSDGVRMCACMCKANLKTILKSFDAKWTVPKYQTCNNLEETKDLKINCYDLVTSDKSRICSCMCSFVQGKSEKKDFTNDVDQALPLNGEISQSVKWEGNSSTEFENQTSEATTVEPRSYSNTDSNVYVTPSTMNPSEDDEKSFTIFVTTEKQSEDILRESTETERDGKEYYPKQNTGPKDNIVIIYPNSYYTTMKPTPLPKPMPTVTRIARSDETVFYVYPQKKVIPEKPKAKSLRFTNVAEDMKMPVPLPIATEQSKLVQMVFAEQIDVTSATVTREHDTNTSDVISLDIEAAPGSPLIISAFPIQENALIEAANKNSSGSLRESKDLANDITGPGESSAENKAEDYMEDDSVTIAYSGKIYRRLPAETAEASSSTIDNQVVLTTEKLISSTSEIPEANNQIVPSAPLLVSLSSGYLAGAQAETSTSSSTTTSTTTTPSTTLSTTTSSTTTSPIESYSTQKTTSPKDIQLASTTAEPSSSTAAVSTPSTSSTTTTESTLSSTVNDEKLDSAEDLKLKKQRQFMEFLKKRSQSSKHRLSATSLKKPPTTHAPSVNVRKTLLDASQRRAALLKSKGKQKPIPDEASSTTETITEIEKVNDVSGETSSQENESTVESTSTTATPRVTHSLRGGILQRRPLYTRTTKPPADE